MQAENCGPTGASIGLIHQGKGEMAHSQDRERIECFILEITHLHSLIRVRLNMSTKTQTHTGSINPLPMPEDMGFRGEDNGNYGGNGLKAAILLSFERAFSEYVKTPLHTFSQSGFKCCSFKMVCWREQSLHVCATPPSCLKGLFGCHDN